MNHPKEKVEQMDIVVGAGTDAGGKKKDNDICSSEQEEEQSILATIGGSLRDQTTYETQILREATTSNAPLLTGIGFPDLTPLAPSYTKTMAGTAGIGIGVGVGVGEGTRKRRKLNGSSISSTTSSLSADIPHIIQVLKQVRLDLEEVNNNPKSSSATTTEGRQAQILRIKYQMLLSYLASLGVPKEEVGINGSTISAELRSEEQRKKYLLRNTNKNMKVKNVDGVAELSAARNNNRGHRVSLRATRDGANRLEQIKRGESLMNDDEDDAENEVEILSKSTTASFGKQALAARNASIAISKHKQSSKKLNMMGLKRRLVENSGEVWVDPELLYQKRLQRRERRRKRRLGRFGKSDSSVDKENKTEQSDDDTMEVEKLSNTNDEPTTTSTSTLIRIENKNGDVQSSCSEEVVVENITKANSTVKIKAEAETKQDEEVMNIPPPSPPPKPIHCSICRQDITIPDDYVDGVDVYLSQHMSSCQESENYTPSRPTRRSRRAVSRQVCYRETDDMDIDSEIDYIHRKAKPSILGKTQKSKKIDQAFVCDDDIGDAETSDDNEPISRILNEEIDEIQTSNTSYSHIENKALDDYNEEDYEDRIDEWIESGIDNMREMREQDENDEKPGAVSFPGGLIVPGWINDRLFGYQRTALRWLWELHMQQAGGVVGDEMGLGKTVQVAAYLGSMTASRTLNSVLIIAPATMLMHWLNELAIWAPGLRRILIHKSGERVTDNGKRNISRQMLKKLDRWLSSVRAERVNEPIDEKDLEEIGPDSFCGTGYVVLTTYENIRRSCDIWAAHKWSYVIIDEGQKIRNPDADVTIACKRFRTPHRILMSGTPIQNDLRELWSLFDFVFPGRLGTLPVFLSEFADPIKRGGYSNATPMQVQLAYRCALVLRDLINPYLLRRQKKDIKEVSRMPGKTEQVLFCKLSPRQRSMYEAYLASDEVRNIIRGSAQCFRPIIMLRKICNHPDLICGADEGAYASFLRNGCVNENDLDDLSSDSEGYDYDESTLVERAGKLEVLSKILPLWKKQGHRVLIFSQWKKMLDIIQHFMNLQGWTFGRLDGNTNVASRQKLVDKFNNDTSFFAMLMTTKTGGVGLNLTGANRIILYDPDWNPQSDAQARERAWRFGQKNAVTVYRLITAGTIEEKIYQRQIFKTALTNQVLQDPRQRRMFSQKDLRDLFTLKTDVHSVKKGGDGVTETGRLTRGRGVVDVDENDDENEDILSSHDNKETLEEVLKSKGLAGVFDHDIVDKPFAKKSLTIREMEDQAKKVAARAAKSLANSLTSEDAFSPTWTGSKESDARRFGGVSRMNSNSSSRFGSASSGFTSNNGSFDTGFGGATSAGLGGGGDSGPMSSATLVKKVQKRRKDIASGCRNDVDKGDDPKADTLAVSLMKRIRVYIRRYSSKSQSGQGPSTDNILHEFHDVKKSDAALFKTILKQVAFVQNGRWELKG